MNRFGQRVEIEVTNASGSTVFKTDSLRIDFDIRHVDTFSRGKVEVYNMSRSTIKEIVGKGVDAFITIRTQLHDDKVYTLCDRWFVSNFLEYTQLPNSIATFYIYNNMKRDLLDKQIKIGSTKSGKLKDTVHQLLRAADFGGGVTFDYFPTAILDNKPPRGVDNWDGSFSTCMKRLKDQYGFNYYTDNNELFIAYKPTSSNYKDSSLSDMDRPALVIDSTMLRANPLFGPAQLQLESNLDPRITARTVLDTSQLVTIQTSDSDLTLSVAEDFLDLVFGYSRFSALTIIHTGSNWVDSWSTKTIAYSVAKGTKMKTQRWWEG